MEERISALYALARRFDEGELHAAAEYRQTLRQQSALYDRMLARFGAPLAPLLEAYTEALYAEMELEAQHYFAEGVRLAAAAGER